jgi:hypothetical protein
VPPSSRMVTTLHRPSTPLVCCANQGMAFMFVPRTNKRPTGASTPGPSRGGEERCVVLYHS